MLFDIETTSHSSAAGATKSNWKVFNTEIGLPSQRLKTPQQRRSQSNQKEWHRNGSTGRQHSLSWSALDFTLVAIRNSGPEAGSHDKRIPCPLGDLTLHDVMQ